MVSMGSPATSNQQSSVAAANQTEGIQRTQADGCRRHGRPCARGRPKGRALIHLSGIGAGATADGEAAVASDADALSRGAREGGGRAVGNRERLAVDGCVVRNERTRAARRK
jgi:hypothetical protein